MRFVWAVVAFVLAALMIGAGIAQRTVLQGPRTVTASVETTTDAPYVLIGGDVLGAHPGTQTVEVEQAGPLTAYYGRTLDLEAWLQKSEYTRVTADRAGDAGTEVTFEATSIAEEVALGDGESAPVLEDSDLWLDRYEGTDTLTVPLQLPEGMSLVLLTDGTAPAPQQVTVSWPTGVATPWAGPLIVGGSLLLVVGLVLYVLGMRHVRRSRGPRRKGLPLAETQPIDLSVEQAGKGVISAAPTRRGLTRGKRRLIAVPAVAVFGLLASGCTADSWPDLGPAPTPSPSASVIVPDDRGQPAVTDQQAARILSRIAAQVSAADEARDADQAALRLDGAALEVRKTDYLLRGSIADFKALDPIPAKPVRVLLPEARDTWPRTFIAAVGGSDENRTLMTVTQQDAWAPYKLSYLASSATDANLKLAPSYVGADSIDPDSPFLLLPPSQLAAAYADVIDKGDESEFASLFDGETDPFRTQVSTDRTNRLAQLNETGSSTAAITFSTAAGESPPVSLATLDSGAIVAVSIVESDKVTPTNEDAEIRLPDNLIVQTLTGVTESKTGFETRFSDQLFFFVPAKSSKARIQFLGYSSEVLDAKVVQ